MREIVFYRAIVNGVEYVEGYDKGLQYHEIIRNHTGDTKYAMMYIHDVMEGLEGGVMYDGIPKDKINAEFATDYIRKEIESEGDGLFTKDVKLKGLMSRVNWKIIECESKTWVEE